MIALVECDTRDMIKAVSSIPIFMVDRVRQLEYHNSARHLIAVRGGSSWISRVVAIQASLGVQEPTCFGYFLLACETRSKTRYQHTRKSCRSSLHCGCIAQVIRPFRHYPVYEAGFMQNSRTRIDTPAPVTSSCRSQSIRYRSYGARQHMKQQRIFLFISFIMSLKCITTLLSIYNA
jgi:hypothetical protein